jgi:tetratricopeptide (TPR) repeat protein
MPRRPTSPCRHHHPSVTICASRRRLAESLLVASLVLGMAAPAHAQDRPPTQADDRQRRATELWKEGLARYNLDQQDEAIDFFTKAYEIYPFPDILFNLGQAHRRKRDWERARFYFLSYLREVPASEDRAEVEGWVRECEAQLASTPMAPRVEPAVTPPLLPETPMQPPPRWYQDHWAWVWTGAGVATAGVAVFGFVSAIRLDDQADHDELGADALHEQADDRRLLGGVAAGLAATLLTVGVVKLVLHDDHHSSVSLRVTPGGATLSWSF